MHRRLARRAASLALIALLGTGPLCAQDGPDSVSTETLPLIDVVAGAGDFTMLVGALQAAGLVETLRGDGPFTVFAPTDSAFGGLDSTRLASLLEPGNKEELVGILTYHVVPGKLMSSDLIEMENVERLETVQGDMLMVSPAQQGLLIGEAAVIKPDIVASNGVIHAIDMVLLPPSMEEADGGQ